MCPFPGEPEPEDGHSASYALVPWKEEVEEYACNLRNIQMGSLHFEWTEHLERKTIVSFSHLSGNAFFLLNSITWNGTPEQDEDNHSKFLKSSVFDTSYLCSK